MPGWERIDEAHSSMERQPLQRNSEHCGEKEVIARGALEDKYLIYIRAEWEGRPFASRGRPIASAMAPTIDGSCDQLTATPPWALDRWVDLDSNPIQHVTRRKRKCHS